MRPQFTPENSLPSISQWQLKLFSRYVRWYLSRNFHNLHLLQLGSLDALRGLPVLVCVNHPSWWDPLLSIHLSQRLFSDRHNYGPMAAVGIAKYRFMERLGFFGIDPHSRLGAEKFLRLGEQCLSRADHALWVTPQGQFVDVRKRPVVIAAGVGHLARRLAIRSQPFAMLPIAFEYAFWNERFAEAFACLGEPVMVQQERSASAWNDTFAFALERTQDVLSQRVQARNPDAFERLLAGRSGVGGIYDLWRAAKAKAQRKKFQPEHGRI